MTAPAQPAEPRRFEDPDRTARARIRDAALTRFATDGVQATSLKAIAADVGVSPPLVIHHFGSKEGLQAACDEYVAAQFQARKRAAMAAGPGLDPFQAMRDAQDDLPMLRYLARTLSDGSPHVARLIDAMVDDAVDYMAEGVARGLLTPTDRPRERAVVLLLWQLGALVLHDHARRLLGIDLTANDPDELIRWARYAGEILANGVLDKTVYHSWFAAAADHTNDKEPS